ncbi:hypothetical protein [Algoriphagus sp.]|uniref:hypothetical protein n=1 Tax=Algoriphagus sp. TaxID=1872435 RepID=UPI0025CF2D7A|nr:hypothetical protein [Algoriphagus sp.]
MIKFFRKIRQKLLSENRFSKYVLYAIGEIALVMIGILLALQVNNANELSKQKSLVATYKNNLIIELKADLNGIHKKDSMITNDFKTRTNYILYYKKTTIDIDTLIQKMDSVKRFGLSEFQSSTYTLDDIISTGKLSLFSQKEIEAILKLKATQDFFAKEQIADGEYFKSTNLEFERTIDLASLLGPQYMGQSIEDQKLEDWRYNVKSEQYRLFSNRTLAIIRNYNFQRVFNYGLRKEIENLITILEKEQE